MCGAELLEQTERPPGEPSEFCVVALRLKFGDHDEWYHDLVLGELAEGLGISEEHRSIENKGSTGSKTSLSGRSRGRWSGRVHLPR